MSETDGDEGINGASALSSLVFMLKDRLGSMNDSDAAMFVDTFLACFGGVVAGRFGNKRAEKMIARVAQIVGGLK